ncbi:hypothetical protein VP01_2603g3 [Puccinia sorghi]|uniref:Uncharacterized protein n=1 Tax=Puccinia sorghi TaxID=27349 RepID=A0A0L6V4Q6_9BASI|nr:hypothetical protein VP01_2603g3 [Puccinia sorghi]
MFITPIPTTDEDLSDNLKDTFGWCWPPYHVHPQEQSASTRTCLPPAVTRYFRQLTPDKQRRLLKFKDEKKNAGNVQELEELYKKTWTIRWIFLEAINKMYLNEPIDSLAAQFWDDDNLSELYWLRLMDLLAKKNDDCLDSSALPIEREKKEDYPININFIPCHPLQSDRPISTNHHAQVESVKHLNATGNQPRFWTIGFQDTTCKTPKLHDICFKRKNPFPNIMISNHIDRLGHMWIEEPRDDESKTDDGPSKKYRILFQKTCSDLDLGLFLWPQFNFKKIGKSFFEKQSEFLPDTPKIPVYQDCIIEFSWASEFNNDRDETISQKQGENLCKTQQKDSIWIDNILQWPNPCERYSHYVQVPHSYPTFDLNVLERTRQETTSAITVAQSEDQECPDQVSTNQANGQPNSVQINRDTLSDECLLQSHKVANNKPCYRNELDLARNSTTDSLFEGPIQSGSSCAESSRNSIFCHSDSTFLPLDKEFLADKDQDPQPVSQPAEKKNTGKHTQQQHIKPSLRHGKENHSNQKEPKKPLRGDAKNSSGSDKSLKRKSPRLIEIANSSKPTTSKRKRMAAGSWKHISHPRTLVPQLRSGVAMGLRVDSKIPFLGAGGCTVAVGVFGDSFGPCNFVSQNI